jgi:hypothetical protein
LNQAIEKVCEEERMLQDFLGGEGALTMRVEFDNCKENEGPIPGGDRLEFELNAFGKPPSLKSADLKRAKINNTKHDAMITFKMCVGGNATS